MSQKKFVRAGSWCAVFGALLLAGCGGSGADGGSSAQTQAGDNNAAESEPTVQALTMTDSGWHACSNEGTTCSFEGTRMVRYGANGQYAYKSATRSIACNSSVFGDPAPGVAKACSISTSPSPYMQDAAKFTLTFRDDFNGTALDSTKWINQIIHVPPSDADDYGVRDGYLRIWPQADSTGEIKSRVLTTYGKFSQAYGYFEMEAKLPEGRGVWPAFWLLNSDDPDNGEPEIDIMEAYPGDDTGYWADANHHANSIESSWFQIGAKMGGLEGKQKLDTPDLSAGFHKYALKWEPNKLSYYFDGKLYYTANVTMSKKMYLLVDIQYSNDNASGVVDSTTPLGPTNSLQVNYIRAWQLK